MANSCNDIRQFSAVQPVRWWNGREGRFPSSKMGCEELLLFQSLGEDGIEEGVPGDYIQKDQRFTL